MLRLGLAVHLMVVALTGPSLCCCTSSKLAAQLARPSAEPAPGHKCGRCQNRSRQHAPSKSNGSSEDSCPCRGQIAKSLNSWALDGHPVKIASPMRVVGNLSLEAGVPLIPKRDALQIEGLLFEPGGFPYLTGKGILRALQTWRC
jgi:hypothetical protein